MKKFTLSLFPFLFLLFYSVLPLSAQITITQSDMPEPTQVYQLAVDASGSLSPQAASSVSQTWNYTTIGNTQTNSYNFVDPVWTTYYPYFHSATIADSLFFAPGFTYYSLTPSSFAETGFITSLYGYTAGVNLHPFFEQISLPATYGTSDSGRSRGDSATAINVLTYDSGRAIVNITYSDSIDAYGVMTTPYGTQNVIRQKHYDLTYDSILVHTKVTKIWSTYRIVATRNYQYRWYANGIPYYFALMQMNSSNTKDSIVQWYNGMSTGINKITHSALTNLYPNPCRTQINFTCNSPDAKYISVYDLTGRRLSTKELLNGTLCLNTLGYSAAIYFYSITDSSGNTIDRGKFSVQ